MTSLPSTILEALRKEAEEAGVLETYDLMVSEGTGPRMALMLCLQSFPGIKGGDTVFNRRENARMKTMSEENLESVVAIAKKAGINTHGKTYNGQLGTYSDPAAWVSSTSDAVEAAKKKGMSLGGNGMVKYEAPQKPHKKKRIAKDILDRLEMQARSKDQSLNAKCKSSAKARTELRERLTEKHTKKPKD